MSTDKLEKLSIIYDNVLDQVIDDMKDGTYPNKDLLNWLNVAGEYFMQKQTRTELGQGEKPEAGW